jgi:amino acid adenylation domain-containing protein
MTSTADRQRTPGRITPEGDFEPFEAAEIETSIPARFEKIARAHADRVAIWAPPRSLTYRALDSEAGRIASALLDRRGDGSEPVAVLLPTGPTALAVLLAILRTGKFYVPLDPVLGEERIAHILEEFDQPAIVADATTRELAARLAGPDATLDLQAIGSEPAALPRSRQIRPDDPAYVLFTSGSTGGPKGIVHSHRSALDNIRRLTNGLHIAADDRLSLLYAFSFGASASDIWGALTNGAALCPYSLARRGLAELPEFLERERVTILHTVPSVFRLLASPLGDRRDRLSLRIVKLGGEPVLASDFELYRAHLPPRCLFHSGFGMTEMHVVRQWFADRDTNCPGPTAPIGYEAEGVEVILLDKDGDLTRGSEGEMAIVSRTLPLGYWNRPEETSDAFGPVPDRPGFRIFRTGDLARRLPDGCLIHAGRRDWQVKIRGQRVPIEAIEAVLAAEPEIRECAVTPDSGRPERLVAYVVPARGQIRIPALRRRLAESLPGPMMPAVFVSVESLPRTPAGKVDRGALPPAPNGRPALDTPWAIPQNDTEKILADLFAQVLKVEPVGADDDFFELGGDSLSALELLVAIEETCGRRLGAAEFLGDPTVAGLARLLGSEPPAPTSRLVQLRRGRRERCLFVVPGGAGEADELLVSARLARRLRAQHAIFGFRSPVPSTGNQPVDELVTAIRGEQPAGPYLLVGECVGGILAHAAATRLRAIGEEVALLALLDTPFPGSRSWLRHVLRRPLMPWGDDLLRRSRHHLRAAPRGKRTSYLLRRLQSAAARLLSLRQSDRRELVGRRNARVSYLLRTNLAPYPGPIRLLVSEEGRRAGLPARWAALASSLSSAEVAGDHNTYIRDHVGEVARILDQWLAATSEQRDGSFTGQA